MSEEAKRQEREFQLQMLETQISCQSHDTLSSIVIAVGYSVSVSLYGIAFTNMPDSIRLELLITATIIFLTAMASFVEYMNFHLRSVPRKMQKLRDRFVKPQAPTTAEPPIITVDDGTRKTKGQKSFANSNNAKK